MKAGAVGYLTKPFGDAALLDCIHEALKLPESDVSRPRLQ